MANAQATADSWPIKPMPEKHEILPIDGTYTSQEFEQIQMGFVPRSRQDKWFIYWDGSWLHFHRSRTGTCIFQMELQAEEEAIRAPRLIVNRDPAQYRMQDDEYNVDLVSYLVDHVLLGRFAQMPLPGKMSPEDERRHRRHVMGEPPGGSGSIRLQVNGR
jgi:hypothetical protein